MDKGYDFPDIRQLVKEYGYTAHIKSRGEENIRIQNQDLGQEDGL